jgi:hypothetical protein
MPFQALPMDAASSKLICLVSITFEVLVVGVNCELYNFIAIDYPV